MSRSARMSRTRWSLLAAVTATAAAGTLVAGTIPAAATAPPPKPQLRVLASGLNNPRHLHWVNGVLYVAEAGKGGNGPCATGPEGTACAGRSGDIATITASGRVTRLMRGLSSIAAKDGTGAGGPADVAVVGRTPVVVVQDAAIDARGRNPFGRPGGDLGRLVIGLRGGLGPNLRSADFARYEALHNPDGGKPTTGPGAGPAIDSDPYGITAYRGGFAVADAAANAILYVDHRGRISTLAVIPTNTVQPPGAPAGTKVEIQAVPTSVRVGPDGALYVSELSGVAGSAKVLRVVPGRKPTVVASGFDSISDIAFDSHGRLLVLVLQQGGLFGPPAPGALIRWDPRTNTRTTLISRGLQTPTGVTVHGGRIYISDNGAAPGRPAPGGQILTLAEPR